MVRVRGLKVVRVRGLKVRVRITNSVAERPVHNT